MEVHNYPMKNVIWSGRISKLASGHALHLRHGNSRNFYQRAEKESRFFFPGDIAMVVYMRHVGSLNGEFQSAAPFRYVAAASFLSLY